MLTMSTVYIDFYVDDKWLKENAEAEYDVVQQLKNGLVLEVSDSLQDYLSCNIWFSKDKKKA